MNSKDLCLLDEIDKLIEAGVDSFKIEGRMKTAFYVATVIRSYRQAIDAYYEGNFNKDVAKNIMMKSLRQVIDILQKDFSIKSQTVTIKYMKILPI